jgi:hypothetical protein
VYNIKDDWGRDVEQRVTLKCGAIGHFENTGYRCQRCFMMAGSMGCPCSKIESEKENNNNVHQSEESY